MNNNLYDITAAILEYVEGHTGLAYAQSNESQVGGGTPPKYFHRTEYHCDSFKQQRVQPTSLIFHDLTMVIQAEVLTEREDTENLTVADYQVVSNKNEICVVNVTFCANLLPVNTQWNHTRMFHFRNGNLRYVD